MTRLTADADEDSSSAPLIVQQVGMVSWPVVASRSIAAGVDRGTFGNTPGFALVEAGVLVVHAACA